MKKTLASLGAMTLIVFSLVLLANFRSTVTSAQNAVAAPPLDSDDVLADRIKRVTDRSGAGLIQRPAANGNGVYLDLDETFQNVMLAQMDTLGEPEAACVTSLSEANDFFRRNLETGQPIASSRLERSEPVSVALRHGMSENEFEFYKELIADAEAQLAASPNGATINIVNGDGEGEGFNDTTAVSPEGGNTGSTRGEQRINLFNFAAGIWGAFLDTTVQIDINAQFNSLSPCSTTGGVLGSAGTAGITRDFENAMLPGTWYHGALANKLEGTDLNGTTADINARFNTDVDNGCLGNSSRFYYGLNNATPSQRINLLVVLLHEMGHGLGFSSFVNGSTGSFNANMPDVFARLMIDKTTGKSWADMNNVERQASAINVGNVFWDGPNVKSASANMTVGRDSVGRVQMHTPLTFASGSSISHFSTAAAPNLLMEPNITAGLPLDLDLTRQQMRDIGWYRDMNGDRVPDTIVNITPGGGSVAPGSAATITWTNTGGFDRNVTVELSTDGGATFPTTIASNIPNTGSVNFTVPDISTTTAKVRVRETGFVDLAGVSNGNFAIGTTGPSAPRKAVSDFDGDGKTDESVFRPSDNVWYLNRSQAGFVGYQFGAAGDVLAPADFTGDGKTDVAVFRPVAGAWFVLKSEDNTFYSANFGANGDIPAPGDFDADGKADVAVFRPSTGYWFIQQSTAGFSAVPFGTNGDVPTLGDFDGDGKTEVSVFRPSSGVWYRLNSSNGSFFGAQFGQNGDMVVPADYSGDGKTDLAIWRPSDGTWYIQRSEDNSFYGQQFGTAGDLPAPGDYDGDGKADTAVFRPSSGTWFEQRSTSGFAATQFGTDGDKPAPSAYVY